MIRKKIWRKSIKILKGLIFLDVGIMGNIYFITFFQNFEVGNANFLSNISVLEHMQIIFLRLLPSELPFGEEVLYINI